MKEKAIIVSGYFNPLHRGHIEYFKLASQHANFLFVIVNNDNQRKLKGSMEFMLEDERMILINELKVVDKVFLSIDQDRSVSKSIEMIYKDYGEIYELSFANGGDQTSDNIPEVEICKKLNIKLIDKLGNKIQSSSWILKPKN